MIAAMTANTTTTTIVTATPTTGPIAAYTTSATAALTRAPTTLLITSSTTPRTVNGTLHSENTSDRATFEPRALYPSVAGVVVVLLVVCLAVILIRKRRIKKTASDESPTAGWTSPGPALPSVRYDHRYSDVELNLPVSNLTYSLPQEHTPSDQVSRKHPIVPAVPADELYDQVNKTTKPEEPHTADNLTYWSAEELPPYGQQKQDDPIGNEDSSSVLPNDLYAVVRRPNDETSSALPNDDLYAVARSPNDETSSVPPNDDLYAVVRKPAHREEKMAPIPKLNMTENDIYGT